MSNTPRPVNTFAIDLTLNPQLIPAWADTFGEDEFGVFAEFELNGVRFVWRWIPPGRFEMGSPSTEPGHWGPESPQHVVTISQGFWMSETPVTQHQWSAVVDDTPSHFESSLHPVDSVNWHQCVEFARLLNESIPFLKPALPSEAQWEYACRAGTKGAFHVDGSTCTKPDGLDPVLATLGWFDANSGGSTHPVREKSCNAWGLFDMHGNVWEWCRDGMREYSSKAETDVLGPMDDSAGRVMRGGSWAASARSCRAAIRDANHPGLVWHDLGFRLSAGQEPERDLAEPKVSARRSRG